MASITLNGGHLTKLLVIIAVNFIVVTIIVAVVTTLMIIFTRFTIDDSCPSLSSS